MRVTWRRAVVVALGVAAMTTGVAAATPGAGAVTEAQARGTMVDPAGEKLKIITGLLRSGLHRSTDVAVQKLTIQPGGHTGWHTHPGPTVVVVKSGTVTFIDEDCDVHTYNVGDAYVDQGVGHVHIARNDDTEPVVLWNATFIPGPRGIPSRVDAADPGCPS